MSFGHMCFFFKQKTEYEMRISDWSSDVCSSDLYTFEHYEIASYRILMATPTTGCGARTRPCTAPRPTDATASTWPEASATPRLPRGSRAVGGVGHDAEPRQHAVVVGSQGAFGIGFVEVHRSLHRHECVAPQQDRVEWARRGLAPGERGVGAV